jgi:hypothetical protein
MPQQESLFSLHTQYNSQNYTTNGAVPNPVSKFNSLCSQYHTFQEGGSLPMIRVENILSPLQYFLPTMLLQSLPSSFINLFNLQSKETKIQIFQIRFSFSSISSLLNGKMNVINLCVIMVYSSIVSISYGLLSLLIFFDENRRGIPLLTFMEKRKGLQLRYPTTAILVAARVVLAVSSSDDRVGRGKGKG